MHRCWVSIKLAAWIRPVEAKRSELSVEGLDILCLSHALGKASQTAILAVKKHILRGKGQAMNVNGLVIQEARELSLSKAREVLDFILFLRAARRAGFL